VCGPHEVFVFVNRSFRLGWKWSVILQSLLERLASIYTGWQPWKEKNKAWIQAATHVQIGNKGRIFKWSLCKYISTTLMLQKLDRFYDIFCLSLKRPSFYI
jgi:hypothetical protein